MSNTGNYERKCADCSQRQQMGKNPAPANDGSAGAAPPGRVGARREREAFEYNPAAIAGLLAACRKLPGFVRHELLRLGVPRSIVEKLPIRQGNIVDVGANRFEFEILCRSCWSGGGKPAIVIPVYDLQGDLVDLAAWGPKTNRLWTWRGLAWALGQHTVFAPRLSEGLLVHRTPLGWLRAGCKGVVIINPRMAREYLIAAGPLIAEDAKHCQELAAVLTQSPPPIYVASTPTAAKGA